MATRSLAVSWSVTDLWHWLRVLLFRPASFRWVLGGASVRLRVNAYLQGVERFEDEAASTIRQMHGREMRAVEAALDDVLRGLSEYGSQRQKPDGRLESARIFLATRSFNSLRMALQVLERGYYQQAMALVRMAKEDQLVARDVEVQPSTLAALFGDEGRIGKFGKMAERVSVKAKAAWDDDYGRLSRFGAHPRVDSLRGLVAYDSSGNVSLRAGGRYDEVWVVAVLYDLTRELVLVYETVAKLTDSVGSDWIDRAIPTLEAIESQWRRIDEWAREQLGKSFDDLE